jgi:hypothetical protein
VHCYFCNMYLMSGHVFTEFYLPDMLLNTVYKAGQCFSCWWMYWLANSRLLMIAEAGFQLMLIQCLDRPVNFLGGRSVTCEYVSCLLYVVGCQQWNITTRFQAFAFDTICCFWLVSVIDVYLYVNVSALISSFWLCAWLLEFLWEISAVMKSR